MYLKVEPRQKMPQGWWWDNKWKINSSILEMLHLGWLKIPKLQQDIKKIYN